MDTTEDVPNVTADTGSDSSVAPVDVVEAPVVPQDAPATDAPTVSGQPRDDAGRFAPKAADPSAAPAAPPAPSLTTDPQPASGLTPDQSPTAPAAPASEPLRFKVSGQTYDIPGSYRTEKGDAVIPAAHVQKFLHLVGQGRHHETSWQVEREKWKAEAATWRQKAEAATTLKEAVFNAKLAALNAVMADPALLESAVANPQGLQAYIEREAKMAEYEAKLAAADAASKPDPNVERAQLESAYRATLEDTLDEAAQHPEYGAILRGPYGPQVRAQIDANPYAFLAQDGQGGYALDVDRLVAIIAAWKPATEQALTVQRQQEAAKKAQAFNAARPAAPVAAPVTAAKKPAPPSEPPRKKTWRELQREIMAG